MVDEGSKLHIASEFENPTLKDLAFESSGSFNVVNSINDPLEVAKLVSEIKPELFCTNDDQALANGVVDEVQLYEPEILLASPTKESSRIEWDKHFSHQLLSQLDKERGTSYTPLSRVLRDSYDQELQEVIKQFEVEDKKVAVKPNGLTGGKGVKVMGQHLENYKEAQDYARSVLNDPLQKVVIIQEKLEGQEFTIQGFTDGSTIIAPPLTYDYPYREDGDLGPGTGGMGDFTMKDGGLPFLGSSEVTEACKCMSSVLEKLKEKELDYRGVLYGSFMKTPQGLKVIEFNARGGDPELINIVELMDDSTSLSGVLHDIARGGLSEQAIRFQKLASVAIYLVAPEYGYDDRNTQEFEVDISKINSFGCNANFSAAIQAGSGRYRTVGSSRTLAISSLSDTPWEARDIVHKAAEAGVKGPLQFRNDIGSKSYIEDLAQ